MVQFSILNKCPLATAISAGNSEFHIRLICYQTAPSGGHTLHCGGAPQKIEQGTHHSEEPS